MVIDRVIAQVPFDKPHPFYCGNIFSIDAFSLRPGDAELLKQINTSLTNMHADGTVKPILAEYGQ